MNKETMKRHYKATPKETLIDILINSREEIERLKEELKYTIPIVEHNKTITKHLKEIERLNNIINKIENFIEDRIDNYKYYECYETAHALETIRNDIKELKGEIK